MSTQTRRATVPGLPLERRAALSQLLRSARQARGISQEQLAELATDRLRMVPERLRELGVPPVPEEEDVWMAMEITTAQIGGLERCPARPIGTHAGRGRLQAVALALGLDLRKVNALAGGM